MSFQDLTRRMTWAVASLLVLSILLLFFSHLLMQWVITLFTAGLGALAMWEFMQLRSFKGEKRYQKCLMGAAVVLIIGFFISTTHPSYVHLPFFLFFLSFIALFCYHLGEIEGCTTAISQGLFALVYIAFPLGLILKILYFSNPSHPSHPSHSGQEGRYFLIYLLAITKVTDTGAYFGGRLFGGRRLAATISPGKTVVGGLIGLLLAVASSLLFYAINPYVSGVDFSFSSSLWLGALIGVIGQVGDLAESLLKRDANVKDSNALPGLGGALDILDSLLFTTPLVYLFLCVSRS